MGNTIYLLVGPSGSGKTTLAALLAEQGMKQVQSYTTRPPRYPNEEGHIFVSDDEFDQLKDFVAYTEFDGHRYGATAQQVEECDIYVIDPAGIKYFKHHYKGNKDVVVVYVQTSFLRRFAFMRKRGDSLMKIYRRFRHDADAFQNISTFSNITIENNRSPEKMRDLFLRRAQSYARQTELMQKIAKCFFEKYADKYPAPEMKRGEADNE